MKQKQKIGAAMTKQIFETLQKLNEDLLLFKVSRKDNVIYSEPVQPVLERFTFENGGAYILTFSLEPGIYEVCQTNSHYYILVDENGWQFPSREQIIKYLQIKTKNED